MAVNAAVKPAARFQLVRWRSARQREDFLTGLICLAPAVVLAVVFVLFPILFSAYLSVHQWNILVEAKPFVGLDNYTRMFKSPEFWLAMKNTIVFMVAVVPIGTALSLGVALIVNRKMRLSDFYRAAYFMPVVTSTVAVAVIWAWLYNPQYGLINFFLRLLHLPAPNWLVDPNWALPGIIIMSIWKNLGYNMIIFLAGMQEIAQDYYEAASLDGAGRWDSFRHITWPLLRPTTGFVLITSTMFSFLVFGPIYVMTRGGPMQSTMVIVYHLYQRAFEAREMGYASAMAWVIFIFIFILTLIQLKFTRKSVTD